MAFFYGISNTCVAVWDYVFNYFSILPKVMYLLTNCFLSIIDFFQMLFRKLAGLDVYYVDGSAREGDIVYHFLSGIFSGGEFPALTTAFWALIVLGIILLFLSTLIAIIRSEYTTTKADNGKGKIIGRSLKSLMYFAIVPIACLLGVYLGNIVLQAIDSATTGTAGTSSIILSENTASGESKTNLVKAYTATNTRVNQDGEVVTEDIYQTYCAYNVFGFAIPTKTTTFSGVVFKAGAYQSNRIRTTANQTVDVGWGTTVGGEGRSGFYDLLESDLATNCNGLFLTNTDNYDLAAEYIDEAFAAYIQLQNPVDLDTDSADYVARNYCLNVFGFATENLDTLNRYNIEQVWYYYDLWQFNYLVACAAGIVMVVIFINIILGLMRRIIELIGLFLISPPIVALMPMDDGKAYNKWKESFISKTIMAYGAVAGMNIVFLILPYLNDIKFFPDSLNFFNILVSTIIIIVALNIVKSFIGLVSGFIGGENAEKAGGEIAEAVGGTIAKAGVMTAAMAATGGAAALAGPRLLGKGVKGIQGFAKTNKANKQKFAQAQKDRADESDRLNLESEKAQDASNLARADELKAENQYYNSVDKYEKAKEKLNKPQEDLDYFNSKEGQQELNDAYEVGANSGHIKETKDAWFNNIKQQKEAALRKAQDEVASAKSEADAAKANYAAKTKARQDAHAKEQAAYQNLDNFNALPELNKSDYSSFGKSMFGAFANMHDTLLDAEGNDVKNSNFLTRNPMTAGLHGVKGYGKSMKEMFLSPSFMKSLSGFGQNIADTLSKNRADADKLKKEIKEAKDKIEAERKAAALLDKK